ncbi:hypothetical protein DQX05_06320 [Paenibacillus thiaminolyticus]|uniref:Uncharacterized protein n=1 Tax=Paenibacillus thiaminolyticus TaxID=49283 RepID=A0A3A3H2Y2_PANTH|nr:hypothetical protein DQX05_06320 [Paenibacillus thiaminolyticus]
MLFCIEKKMVMEPARKLIMLLGGWEALRCAALMEASVELPTLLGYNRGMNLVQLGQGGTGCR